MKIIQVHNYYQHAGGEDAVVRAELELLRFHGDEVVTYYKDNSGIVDCCWLGVVKGWKLLLASLKTIWNGETYREFRRLLQAEKPDVVHCHNTFPLISPSIYWACANENVPVVQTLHNYRLLCLNAFLFRQSKRALKSFNVEGVEGVEGVKNVEVGQEEGSDSTNEYNDGSPGAICELCVRKRLKWPGIRYRCYRDSYAGSFIVALMLFIHRLIGTWKHKVTAYIALTEFQKQKMVESGLPEDKIRVKPNFVQEEVLTATEREGTQVSDFNDLNDIQRLTDQKLYCLFVGRLSPEKGCDVLIRAWHLFCDKWVAENKRDLSDGSEQTSDLRPLTSDFCPPTSGNQPKLIIVGDGPEREKLEHLTSDICPPSSVLFSGRRSKTEVKELMGGAAFLVSPSVCYETFGLVVLEAGMQRTPSIVAEPGTIAGLIKHGETGLLFPMDDDQSLADKIEWAFRHPAEMKTMGDVACRTFESKYSGEVNYHQLTGIYRKVMQDG